MFVQVQSRPGGSSTVQRIILPAAPNQVTIRPAPTTMQGAQIIRTTLAATGTIGNNIQLFLTSLLFAQVKCFV